MNGKGPYRRRIVAFAAGLAGLPLIMLPAQAIRGTVVDSTQRAPLSAVTVLLLLGDSTVATVRTDLAGAFLVTAPHAGRYRIVVRRFGYSPYAGAPVTLAAGETQPLRVALQPVVTTLDTVRASGSTTLFKITSGREWFTKHEAEGKGMFFYGADVLNSRRTVCDYLGNLPGLTLTSLESVWGILCEGRMQIVTSRTGNRCVAGRVDRTGLIASIDSADIYVQLVGPSIGGAGGAPPTLAGDPRNPFGKAAARAAGANAFKPPPEVPPLHTVPLESVRGIEVYHTREELPRDFGIPMYLPPLTYTDEHGFGPKGMPGNLPSIRDCIWIQIWTTIAW